MPKTKFQESIFTFITSGCMIFIMGVYNVAIHTGELQAATFKHALHSFPLEWFIGLLCAFFIASKNVQILRIPRGKINWPTNLHHPLHPDLHSLYNGAAYEPAWNHRIIRNHFKPDFYLAPDHLSKFHYGLPTADLSCWSVLPLHIPSPVRLHQPRKWI